jgi:hypothetical protein
MTVIIQMALAHRALKEVESLKRVEKSKAPSMAGLTLIGLAVENDHRH